MSVIVVEVEVDFLLVHPAELFHHRVVHVDG